MQRGTAVQWLSISLLDSWALAMVQASTTLTGMERVGCRGSVSVLPHCELQPLAGVLVSKMQQDFIPL